MRLDRAKQKQNPELRSLSAPSQFSLAAIAKIALGHLPRSTGEAQKASAENKRRISEACFARQSAARLESATPRRPCRMSLRSKPLVQYPSEMPVSGSAHPI